MSIQEIETRLQPLREALRNHDLYKELSSLTDIKIFMENHIYAVWDFMSLLKALQQHLTCTSLPWKPAPNTNTARFINEIVLEEESDKNEEGLFKSHYEMYLDAMDELSADSDGVRQLLEQGNSLDSILEVIQDSNLYDAVKNFLSFTFKTIRTNEPHKIAAAFTFGREDLIPDMFLKIVEHAGKGKYPKLAYYLNRHIELDGDDHGPLSLRMIEELCGTDPIKWQEVSECSEKALEQRIALWNHISDAIKRNSEVLA